MKALTHWRHYLGWTKTPFTILTDHANLQYWKAPQKLNHRTARWHANLQEYNFTINVTTLQGRLATRLSEALEQSSGMTLRRASLVLIGCLVRSVRQRKVTPWLLRDSLKGLILRQEVEDREERRRRIRLQYCERRTL